MVVDHICFAVRNLNDGIAYWENIFGYRQLTEIIENSRQKVKVVFLAKHYSVTIKLIEPFVNNQALLSFVKKGGGFHHLCFKCNNIDQEMKTLTEKGLLTLVPPQSGEAFNNHKIAFMLARYGINIEIIDTDEKAGIL
jgi:methylmalonyl-CoA/ethylmalonyl-CoA epimerase